MKMIKKEMSLAIINHNAIPQGWFIANSSAGKPEIQRIDDPLCWGQEIMHTFTGDTEAISFIKKQAKKGDDLAIAAIKYLIKHNSTDIEEFDMASALPQKGKMMKTITKKITLPRCWQSLLDIDYFDDDVTSGNQLNGFDDPEPHYDDTRSYSGKFSDGADFRLELCSGQSNYWASMSIYKGDMAVYEEVDPIECLNDTIECQGYNDITYILEIEWTGDVPSWVDRHSVNCWGCGQLVDERECIPNTEDGGDICYECQQKEKR